MAAAVASLGQAGTEPPLPGHAETGATLAVACTQSLHCIFAGAAACLLCLQVYETVTIAVPVPDCYSSWQQAPATGAPTAPQYTADALAQQPYQASGPYPVPSGPPQQQPYAEQQYQQGQHYQQPPSQFQQPPYQQNTQYGYPQPQEQQYQDYQQPQGAPAYPPAAATYADPQAGQYEAVPGAVCYVDQQQQGQNAINKAGDNNRGGAAAVPPEQWGYGYGQPVGAVPAPTAPGWPS